MRILRRIPLLKRSSMLRDNQTDEELMALYQEGSEDAFKVLYSRHSGKIFGYLKSRTSSAQEATDLFQEVFVKIHKSKHLYNKSLPVLPWIFSVTHSVLVDGIRKIERKRETFGMNLDEFSAPPDEESVASVTPLLKELPGNQQVALHMRYVEEKTFEEIAERLKTSPMNVRQIVSRGVKHLKSFVKEGDRP
jgi:RNA polymerase sigma-70 factor (ECF subfamily)